MATLPFPSLLSYPESCCETNLGPKRSQARVPSNGPTFLQKPLKGPVVSRSSERRSPRVFTTPFTETTSLLLRLCLKRRLMRLIRSLRVELSLFSMDTGVMGTKRAKVTKMSCLLRMDYDRYMGHQPDHAVWRSSSVVTMKKAQLKRPAFSSNNPQGKSFKNTNGTL